MMDTFLIFVESLIMYILFINNYTLLCDVVSRFAKGNL